MNHSHEGQGFLDLVGLQVSNQVPANRFGAIGQNLAFLPKFLGVVFAEIENSADPAGL